MPRDRTEWERRNREAAAKQEATLRRPTEPIFSTRASRERKALSGAPENKMQPADDAAPENKDASTDALADVTFASPAAHGRATELGLTADSFKRRRKSSDRGFTLADVERVAVATGDDEDPAA